jgi:tetratricopeptide (TPR) repeat protein
MDSERWRQIAEFYHAASEREPAERGAFLAEACGGDGELRKEVESLLAQDVPADGLIEWVAEHALEWQRDPPDGAGERALPAAIGRYRILELIGQGGMGAVYKAEQDHPRRTVALKIIPPGLQSPEMLRRFEQELQALGRLHHPGIAQIYDAGTAETGFGPRPFFAMEFIRGHSLLEYARAERLTVRQKVDLMARVCAAVHHAHVRGVIHRDLKPGNILVDESGQPKILDFGVARVIDSGVPATRHTDLGKLVGTLAYMSPEQVLGDPSELDARSDIYTLGVVLYELLAGRLPYETGGNITQAAKTIREEYPPLLGTVCRECRGDIETIASKALEKDKSRRYARAADLAEDLRRSLADQPILARPPSAAYQLHKLARRYRGWVAGGLAVLLALIAGIVGTAREAIRASRAEQEAKAVNDFLQNDLLAQASARGQAGTNNPPDPDLKVRTALDRAAARIAGKFDSQPLVEAAIRETIATSYRHLSLFQEARPQIERALDLRRRFSGAESPETLTDLNELGHILIGAGRQAEAAEVLARVVEVRRRTLGERHRDTLAAMNDLAMITATARRAEELYAHVLAGYRGMLGHDHPDTAAVINNLAALYGNQGRYDQAVELYRQAVEIKRRALGPDHPSTLLSINSLGVMYRKQGKYAEAEAQISVALEGRRRGMGELHVDTLASLRSLAMLFQAQRRLADAERLLRQVVDARRSTLGAEHPETLTAVHDLAELSRRQGKDREAESLFRQVLEARRRVLGPEHRATLAAMVSLGELKLWQRRYQDAEPLLRQAWKAYEKAKSDNWQRYHAQAMLGEALARLGKPGEAMPLLHAGHEGLLQRQDSIPAESRSVVNDAQQWLAQAGAGVEDPMDTDGNEGRTPASLRRSGRRSPGPASGAAWPPPPSSPP